MSANSQIQAGCLQRLAWRFTRRVATVLLAMLLATSAQAEIVLEHIDGSSSAFKAPALSGDGEWMVWKETIDPPVIGLQNISTGALTLLDLRSTTGDDGLIFTSVASIDINFDGSRIVSNIGDDGHSVAGTALVVDATGAEIARLAVVAENTAEVALDNTLHIDKSGRYVAFSVGRGLGGNSILTSEVVGGGGDVLISTGSPRDVFRFDVIDGDIEHVSIGNLGGELDNHAIVNGISDGGRYVLFSGAASNLDGADGKWQAYVRDMAISGAESVEHVSVDPDELAHNGVYTPYLSDDGSRILMYHRINDPEGQGNHLLRSYLWERGKGTRLLTEFTTSDYYGRHLSGDGRWVVGGHVDFSRLNLDTGGLYSFTGADENDQTLIDKPIQSSNGEVLLFQNTSLTRPPGEDGTWWVLRYDALPTLEALVSEVITVTDEAAIIIPLVVEVFETIHVSDIPRILPNITVSVLELITINDEPLAEAQPLPGDVITITPLPAPLMPGSVFQADAGGFKLHTQVQAFLQSEPVLVGVETADADGKVSFMITIPADFSPGDHTLILLGQKPDDSERRLTASITIELPDVIFKDSFE